MAAPEDWVAAVKFAQADKGLESVVPKVLPLDRVWENFIEEDKGHTTPCWIWQKGLDSYGYGVLSSCGKQFKAHRIAWELTHGLIPDGLQTDHLCRTRSCIRPDHIELVTTKENVLRGEGITAKNATKTHCAAGHEFLPENTWVHKGERVCLTCKRTRNREYMRKQGDRWRNPS